MKEQYEHMTEEIRQQFIKRINESFIAYQAQFTSMRENYRSAMESMILSVEDKSYSMKAASMTQRSMILVLFEDYCDTKFYHGFMNCYEDEMPVPSMGESYLVIVSFFCLENLKKVKKNSIS